MFDNAVALNVTRAALSHACRLSGDVKNAELLVRMHPRAWDMLQAVLYYVVHGHITVNDTEDPELILAGELTAVMKVMRVPCYQTMEYLMMTHHGVAYQRRIHSRYDFDSEEEAYRVMFDEEIQLIEASYDILDMGRYQHTLQRMNGTQAYMEHGITHLADARLGMPEQVHQVNDLLLEWREGNITVPTLYEFK